MNRSLHGCALILLVAALLTASTAAAEGRWVIWVVDFERALVEVEAGKSALARAKAYEEKRNRDEMNIDEIMNLGTEFDLQREKELAPVREKLRQFILAEAEKNKVHWIFEVREVAFAKQGHDVTAKLIAEFNKANR